ncbi:MAG: hypothetical protein HY919_00295 [Elusimicrobia bacterium]|nr:hypothetical protein [Elusimicrobiota bacterium]
MKPKCPKCNSEEFVTKPNRYDILKLGDKKFDVVKSEFTEDKYKMYCRDCGSEIDEKSSMKKNKITLKT